MKLSRRNTLGLAAGWAMAAGLGLDTLGLDPLGGPARAAGKRGGTLVIGGAISLRHFNGAIQSGVATALPSTQIFASPLRFDADWNPQPYLARSWEVAPDGLSVTLHMVEGAMFHDGQPVTSADVAFSIGVIKANHPFQTMLAAVEAVDTPDPHTAVIRLTQPHPALILAMSPGLMPILPRHVYGDGQDIQAHPANLKPVGSGPFRLAEYKPNEYWALERFDRFFVPDRPYLDRIVGRVINDPSVQMLGLERGELHLVPFTSGVRDIERAERMPGVTATAKGHEGIGALTWLAFNTQRKPLDDKRVRQAICYAADRDALLRRVMGGKAVAATGPIVASSPFFEPDVPAYKLDLDKANALLDEAGHKRGSDGTRFPLVIDSPVGNPEQARNIAEFLRVQLRRVGIAAEVRVAPDFPTWAQRIGNWDFDLTTDNVFNWGDPVIGVHRTYLSSNIRKGVIWSNTQGYKNPRVDALLAAAAVETDAAKRRAAYSEFQKIVVDDAPILFLNEVPYRTVLHKGLGELPTTIWGTLSPMDGLYWETPPA